MNNDQPAQSLTDAELAQIREDYEGVDPYDSVPRLLAEVDRLRAELAEVSSARDYLAGRVEHYIDFSERETQRWETADAEITQLRAENHAVTEENSALLRKLEEQYRLRAQSANEITRIRAEATDTALGHLTKIERLQSQRDALVRKLGLDWGPDEFGDLDAVPTADSADRSEMLNDLQWYITDIGPEHWQNCDIGDEDCYMCSGHVAIRDRWKGVE